MADRLAEIAERYAFADPDSDSAWLVAEVGVLREALTALLAATEFMAGEGSGVMTQAIIERFDAARAAAAAVLGTESELP